MMHVAHNIVVIVLQSYLMKLYPKHIRAMCLMVGGVSDLLGQFFYLQFCLLLFNHGTKYPFFGIAMVDLMMMLVSVVLVSLGYLDDPFNKHKSIANCCTGQSLTSHDHEHAAYQEIKDKLDKTPLGTRRKFIVSDDQN